MKGRIAPYHPGIHLAEFLDEYSITEYRVAKEIHVPARRIDEIVKGQRRITADTAIRLSRYFGNSAQFWLNLQSNYDLKVASKKVIKKINPIVVDNKEIESYD